MRRASGDADAEMITLEQIKLPIHAQEHVKPRKAGELLADRAAKLLHIDPSEIQDLRILRHSIDARKKPLLFDVYTVEVQVSEETQKRIAARRKGKQTSGPGKGFVITRGKPSKEPPLDERTVAAGGEKRLNHRPVIAGAGPAGLFCGLKLAALGYRPILLERGGDIAARDEAIRRVHEGKEPDPACNIQFGLGGAGTYSDGKLNTGVRDREGYAGQILAQFVRMGAPEDIVFEAQPHIGTDRLKQVVENLRRKIEELGGEVRLDTALTGLVTDSATSALCGIATSRGELPAEALVLAVGHSARDTFRMLADAGLTMEQKAFAVGFRVIHAQTLIDHAQYGLVSRGRLPAASYKLTSGDPAVCGRAVYSFCMCPGGQVVNASSEPGGLCVNGMSYRARDGRYANSAIVASVTPGDYATTTDPLAGMLFQRQLEARAFKAGAGDIPVCTLRDLAGGDWHRTEGLSDAESMRGFDAASCFYGRVREADLKGILPPALLQAILTQMPVFGRRIRGFDDADTLFAGVESRTSSPVRIVRGENGCSLSHPGIFPCGEGAGYAGGIMSAAMDGLRTAARLCEMYAPPEGAGI